MAEQLALESSSTSRQKSCNICVKAKRGCDKRQPICSRCEQKNLLCIYAKRTYGDAFHEEYYFDHIDQDMSWAGFTALASSVNAVDSDPLVLNISNNLETPMFSDLDELAGPFRASSGLQEACPDGAQLVRSSNNLLEQQQQQQKIQTLNKFDYTQMADICVNYKPWQVYDPTTKAHFIVKSMKDYPAVFAKDNHTPWMHRQLYKDEMPFSIQSCFTTSVLYSNMTDSNKPSVFRVLCQSLDELKQNPARTPGEKLARVQALLLYQIICLFDGDVTLKSSADRDMKLLQEWVGELCTIRENLGSAQSTSSSLGEGPSPPRSWEWWIFSESVRRTIIIVYTFLGMWSMFCQNDADVFSSWKYLHFWTVSRSLWEAASSFDFFLLWRDTPLHEVANYDFRDFLKVAKGAQVDDFSRLMLVMLRRV